MSGQAGRMLRFVCAFGRPGSQERRQRRGRALGPGPAPRRPGGPGEPDELSQTGQVPARRRPPSATRREPTLFRDAYPDHDDAPSWWLRWGPTAGGPDAGDAGVAAEVPALAGHHRQLTPQEPHPCHIVPVPAPAKLFAIMKFRRCGGARSGVMASGRCLRSVKYDPQQIFFSLTKSHQITPVSRCATATAAGNLTRCSEG